MKTEMLTALQKVKYDLLQRYKTLTLGKQQFVGRSMEIAYSKGLDDAFEWVRTYNEANKNLEPRKTALEPESIALLDK